MYVSEVPAQLVGLPQPAAQDCGGFLEDPVALEQAAAESALGLPPQRLSDRRDQALPRVEPDRLVPPAARIPGVAEHEEQTVDEQLRPDRQLDVATRATPTVRAAATSHDPASGPFQDARPCRDWDGRTG